jgi:hypothetical protein
MQMLLYVINVNILFLQKYTSSLNRHKANIHPERLINLERLITPERLITLKG